LDEIEVQAGNSRLTSQRRASSGAHQRALRDRVEELQIQLSIAETEKVSLRGTVQVLTVKLEDAERQKSLQESIVSRLQDELAKAQALLRSRQSAENTQITIAGLQEVGKIGAGAAVALLQNRMVKEFQQESGAAKATQEPSQLERLILWQQRIPAAKQQGWHTRSETN
jgi:hypothetical protein